MGNSSGTKYRIAEGAARRAWDKTLGGEEAYKSCRVCGKRIPRVSRMWRSKCSLCGHRTCNRHMGSGEICQACERDDQTVRDSESTLDRKLEKLKAQFDRGLIDEAEFKEAKRLALKKFAEE